MTICPQCVRPHTSLSGVSEEIKDGLLIHENIIYCYENKYRKMIFAELIRQKVAYLPDFIRQILTCLRDNQDWKWIQQQFMNSKDMSTYTYRLSAFNDFVLFAGPTSGWNTCLEKSLFRCQIKQLIPWKPNTAATVESQTNSLWTPKSQSAVAAADEILPVWFSHS